VNSVHDMGGMQGFGPVVREENEPVFHAPWEARVMAIRRALGATGQLPPTLRPAIERIPPAEYLRMSYYELWFTAVVELLRNRKPPNRTLSPADAAEYPFELPPVMLQTDAPPKFRVDQSVRARNIHPVGHTRLPRYVRGHVGTVEAPRGVQAFPDAEGPQHVYCVRFPSRELWGEEAPATDSVYVDLWENYLEPA